MANWTGLKDLIDNVVRPNGIGDIDGANLQAELFRIIDSLGGYTFAGVATDTTDPANPDGKFFYLASLAGVYTNFSNITINADEIAVLYGTGTTWTKASIIDLSSYANADGGEIMGVAIPTTNPTPSGIQYYFANQEGTYTNFDGLTVSEGELVLFKYKSGAWEKMLLLSGLGATEDTLMHPSLYRYTEVGRPEFAASLWVAKNYPPAQDSENPQFTFSTNQIQVSAGATNFIYGGQISDESTNYPDGYVLLRIQMFPSKWALLNNSATFESYQPPMIQLISRDNLSVDPPTGNSPFTYVDANAEVISYGGGYITIKIPNIDTYTKWTIKFGL